MNIKIINSYGRYKCKSCGKIILGEYGLYMVIENGAVSYECKDCHDTKDEEKRRVIYG